MSTFRGPWRIRPSEIASNRGATSTGVMWCGSGQHLGYGNNWVEIFTAAPNEPEAVACNVRMLDPLVNIRAHADAFTIYGYAQSSSDISLFVREGDRRVEQRRQVVKTVGLRCRLGNRRLATERASRPLRVPVGDATLLRPGNRPTRRGRDRCAH